ncbi:helix-turn-helix domain-containing protein [Labrys neptuniae]
MQAQPSLGQLRGWSQGVVAAAMATSSQETSANFTAAARSLLSADQVYIGLYLRDFRSVTIDDQGPDPWNRDYDARLYRQDPFFRLFAKSRRDFLLPLSALADGDFCRSAYYREFYEPSLSFDEITGVFNLDKATAGYVTFLRRKGASPFGPGDLAVAEAVSDATRLVLERLFQTWRLEERGRGQVGGLGTQAGHHGAQNPLPGLRLSQLSARERQIAGLLINGGCAKSISRSLSISSGTVRNHIKKVYRKLGIHSQVELMAIARDTMP